MNRNNSSNIFALFAIVICLTAVRAELWAFLVAGGGNWISYHREADVCNLYQILRANNVPKENIVVMMPDAIAYNSKNLYPGFMQYYPYGPNVYEDVIIDYARENVTANNFYNILWGNKQKVKGGSGKVIESQPDDTVLVYISSPGWYTAAWLNNDETIYASSFTNELKALDEDERFEKMFVMLEKSDGQMFFDGLLPEDISVFALATTADGEITKLCHESDELNVLGLASCYSLVWTRLLQLIGIRKDINAVNLFDYYQLARSIYQETNVNFYGELEIGQSNVKHFFGNPNHHKSTKPLTQQIKVNTNMLEDEFPAEMLRLQIAGTAVETVKQDLEHQLALLYENRVNITNKMDAILKLNTETLLNSQISSMNRFRDTYRNENEVTCCELLDKEIKTRCLEKSQDDYIYLYSKIMDTVKTLCTAGVNIDRSMESIKQVCL